MSKGHSCRHPHSARIVVDDESFRCKKCGFLIETASGEIIREQEVG